VLAAAGDPLIKRSKLLHWGEFDPQGFALSINVDCNDGTTDYREQFGIRCVSICV
jgi:hypothetical protein